MILSVFDNKPLLGAWVRIHFDFGVKAVEAEVVPSEQPHQSIDNDYFTSQPSVIRGLNLSFLVRLYADVP